MRRCVLLVSLLVLLAPSVAVAAPLDRAVTRELARVGGASGAFVLDTTTGRTLAAVRPNRARIPASVQKIYTSAAAILRFGPDGALYTRVLGDGRLTRAGVWRGDLYLRGGGDPTLGSERFTRYAFGTGTTIDAVAQAVAAAGIRRISGRVYGDESAFDLLRGGPASGWGYDIWIGAPLTALLYNRGLANENGSARQRQPAKFAAKQLTAALRRAGVRVARPAASGTAPEGATELAAVPSPPISTLARLTLVPSDNLVAEMLLKSLGVAFGGEGSTTAGAAVVRATVAPFGARPRIADGSGLSRSNATTPRHVVRVLDAMRDEPGFRSSLAVAGRTGTLARRMTGTLAQGRCEAKTGTLSNVSSLAGYCRTRNRHIVAFAFLFNGVNTVRAKAAEDRLAAMLARQRPAGTAADRRPPAAAREPATATAPAATPRSGGATAARASGRVAAVRAVR